MTDEEAARLGRLERLAETLLDEADAAVQAADWNKVRDLAEQALIAHPENAEASAFLAIAGRRLASRPAPLATRRERPRPVAAASHGSAEKANEHPPPTSQLVGQRIRLFRHVRGLTQTDVAAAAGITQAALSNYERGKRRLALPTIVNLATVLEIDLAQLLDLPDIRRSDALELTGTGTSSYDSRTGRREWSSGIYHLLGVEPGSIVPHRERTLSLVQPEAQDSGHACILSFVHPDDRALGQAWLRELRSGRQTGPYELRLVAADGKIRHVEGFGRVEFDTAGGVRRYLATMYDVTERAEAVLAERETNEHLSRALNIAKIVSWEVDLATGTLNGTGPLTGSWDSGSSVPRLLDPDMPFGRVHPSDRAMVAQYQTRALRGEANPAICQFRTIGPDGSIRVLHTISEVLEDDTGRPLKVIGTTQDITELQGWGAQSPPREA